MNGNGTNGGNGMIHATTANALPPPQPAPPALPQPKENSPDAAGIMDRHRVAMEIITSEVFYLNHVEMLEKLQEDLYEESILLVEHNKRIFSNISEIRRINHFFLQHFQKLTENWCARTCVGGLFKAFAKHFRHYSSYAANFQLADDLVSKLLSDKTGNEKFKAKIRDFELSVKDTIGKNNNGKNGSACLDLRSFLIMPVQRVPRYKVLIEELLKLTPNHFPDKELLKQAFKSIKETATFIDETIRFKEGLTSTKKLCDRFKPRLAWLVQPGRALVMRGTLEKVSKGMKLLERTFFLFSDNYFLYADKGVSDNAVIFTKPRTDTLCGAETLSRIDGQDQERKRFGPRWTKKRTKKSKRRDKAINNDPNTITRDQMIKKFDKMDNFFFFLVCGQEKQFWINAQDKMTLLEWMDAFTFVWPSKSHGTISMRITKRRSNPPKPVSKAIRRSLRLSASELKEQIDGALSPKHSNQQTMTKAELLHHAWVNKRITANKYVEILKVGVENSPEGIAILRSLAGPSPTGPSSYAPARHPVATRDNAYIRRHPSTISTASAASAGGASPGGWWTCPFCGGANQPVVLWCCSHCGRMRETMDDGASVGSSVSDVSYLSFRTEYSLRSGVSDTGQISLQERQENLNRNAMILKKCQEALAAKRFHSHTRRHSTQPDAHFDYPHGSVPHGPVPHGPVPHSSSMPYLRDPRRLPQYYPPNAPSHMAPHAPHADTHTAPHAATHARPPLNPHAPAHAGHHPAHHPSQHPAPSSNWAGMNRERRIPSSSDISVGSASSSRAGPVMNPDGQSPLLISGIGSVRHAQRLLNRVPANQDVVGTHRMVIVYSTRKHAYFAILRDKGENGKWKQGVRCTFENVDNLQKITLIEPAEE